MREFVHEPMKTRSRRMSCIGVPACRSMYTSARSSPSVAGSGTRSVTGTTWAGLVPQLTIGLSASASTTTSRSKLAPSSVRSCAQASSTSAPRSATQAKVVSSGATIPARPPPSMVMLQTVMRPSIDSASMAGPAYSTTWPTAPSTPIWPMVPRMRSLAVTP